MTLCYLLFTVTPVRSARQVIDALNAEGPEIDIILAEIDLPMTKGMKMLKYIMRDKELRRIPVISKFSCSFFLQPPNFHGSELSCVCGLIIVYFPSFL